MAKDKKNMTPEEQKQEKERLEREKREKAEIEKKQKEREKNLKERQKRKKKRIQREKRKINEKINMPFKLLLNLAIVGGLITFLSSFFGRGNDLVDSIYHSFIVFSGLFLGIGIVMAIIFFFVSENKIKEEEEEKRKEAEQLRIEEKKKEKELKEIEALRSSARDDNEVIKDRKGVVEEKNIPGQSEEADAPEVTPPPPPDISLKDKDEEMEELFKELNETEKNNDNKNEEK